MNMKPVLICVSLLALGLGGCASAPHRLSAAPAIPGYTFGYHVTGGKATLISNGHVTWLAMPAKVTLQQAEGDGHNVPFHPDGAYWRLQGVASHWKLYTSNGPLSAQAPSSVGVLLAGQQQAKATHPINVHKTRVVRLRFAAGSSTLSPADRSQLKQLAHTLTTAHSVQHVAVEGRTSPAGSMSENAKLGSDRAQVVAGWLMAHGVPQVNDLGWAPGTHGTNAVITAAYTVRQVPKLRSAPITHPLPSVVLKSASKVAPRDSKVASKPAKVAHKAAQVAIRTLPMIPAKPQVIPPKAPRIVFTTAAGGLLSTELQSFLGHQGWSLVWTGHTDYAIGTPGRYTGHSVKGVLMQVARDYHVRVRMFRGNHIVAVGGGENE